jgi:hypothetical protein
MRITSRTWHRPTIALGLSLWLLPSLASSAPSVTVTAPSPASGTVNVVGQTSSTSGMKRLDVLVDGQVKKSCTSKACSYALDTTAVPNGAHTVRAKRIATNGSAISSTLKTIQVANAPPPPLPEGAVSLWPPSATPVHPSDPDAAAVELGVTFEADVPGDLLGVRFYKGSGNGGTHVGSLWDASGTRLVQVTFTQETASGWQQALFAAPVPLAAFTRYVASYHAPQGHYAGDNGGLSAGVANPPLRALANGGVYHYGSTAFPTDTYQASNYWVDVVFLPGAGEPPPPPPPPPPPSSALEALTGPLSPIGTPSGSPYAAFDSAQQSLSASYAASWPQQPGDLVSSYYYDLGLSLYHTALRTGDAARLAEAREVTREWRDSPALQSLHPCMEQPGNPFNYALCDGIPAARNIALGGVAVLALEAGDAEASSLLDLYARYVRLKTDEDFWDDPRENGYKLMYLTAAVAMGYDHRALVKTLLDTSLAQQRADGSWAIQATYEGCSYQYPENFMLGLLMEGLILYDRVIGDPRILPAVRKTADWLWATQWNASLLAFRYSPPQAEGCIPGSPSTHLLSGLYLPGWGYLLARTGQAAYATQAEAIFQGLVQQGLPNIGTGNVKFFNQVFRSSSQYLGYRSQP